MRWTYISLIVAVVALSACRVEGTLSSDAETDSVDVSGDTSAEDTRDTDKAPDTASGDTASGDTGAVYDTGRGYGWSADIVEFSGATPGQLFELFEAASSRPELLLVRAVQLRARHDGSVRDGHVDLSTYHHSNVRTPDTVKLESGEHSVRARFHGLYQRIRANSGFSDRIWPSVNPSPPPFSFFLSSDASKMY